MDKAGITVSAAHRQMMATTSANAAASSGMLNFSGNDASVHVKADEDDSIAAACQLISSKGFQPLKDVMSMKTW